MSTTSGWGRFTWGQANWNEDTTLKTGWGAQAWSDGEWGELKDAIALPTGLSITSSVGSVDVPDQIITPTSFEITASQGEAFVPVVIEIHLYLATSSIGSVSVVDMQVGLDWSINNFFNWICNS